ncbi:MAG TPA: hypothetical protein VFQ22_08715 [Longimicrobiales bacterium]|nr:hypothetical protein [Longimicrobiales bacterium]
MPEIDHTTRTNGRAPHRAEGVTVAVTIDTEEDNWGSYESRGATTRNILELPALQEVFDRWSVRPTYLVNWPPLVSSESVAVLGSLAAESHVEIGTHCHPWNTPPITGEGVEHSMMFRLSPAENSAKIAEVGRRIVSELGVRPRVFRAGRWGFGPTVARALVEQGYEIDSSVTPFIDWSNAGGPDFSSAPHWPYRFDPISPLVPKVDGALLELPPTIGFLGGQHRRAGRLRTRLEGTWLSRRKVIGLLDRAGLIARRWLSPEVVDGETMIRLAQAWVASGERFVHVALHSSTLLPGATPFVRSDRDRRAFLATLDAFFRYCRSAGFTFVTLSEAGAPFTRPESVSTGCLEAVR